MKSKGTPALKISPHPDLDEIEDTPLPVGEGPGVRDINHYLQLSVAPYRGMITRNDSPLRTQVSCFKPLEGEV